MIRLKKYEHTIYASYFGYRTSIIVSHVFAAAGLLGLAFYQNSVVVLFH